MKLFLSIIKIELLTYRRNDALLYANDKYWINEKFNNKLFLENFFYWDLYNDFFKLLNSKKFI